MKKTIVVLGALLLGSAFHPIHANALLSGHNLDAYRANEAKAREANKNKTNKSAQPVSLENRVQGQQSTMQNNVQQNVAPAAAH